MDCSFIIIIMDGGHMYEYFIGNSPIFQFLNPVFATLTYVSTVLRHNGPEGWVLLLPGLNFKFIYLPKQASESRRRCNHYKAKRNTDQTSAQKSCLNFNFKILTKPCAQSLNKGLALWQNLSFQICNKLLPTRFSSLPSATVITSTSFE